jgi:hypothetical protein
MAKQTQPSAVPALVEMLEPVFFPDKPVLSPVGKRPQVSLLQVSISENLAVDAFCGLVCFFSILMMAPFVVP